MKKNGFTLIELLVTIIILSIVSLIATPIMLKVIDDARDSANKSTAYGILDAGHLYYAESVFDDSKATKINDLDNLYDDVVLGGEIPEEGDLYVNSKGLTALAVVIDNKCYKKELAGDLEVLQTEECILGYVGNDSIEPTVTFQIPDNTYNENGWSKSDISVFVNVEDEESGGLKYRWCSDTTPCEPTVLVEEPTGMVEISTESKNNIVCAIGYDNGGNYSDVICSESYKVDKTIPSFEGIEDFVINKDEVMDLSLDVSSNDALSGVNNTFTYNPASIDTSKAGTTDVTYTVSDLAGNINTITRKIIVDAEAPTVTYTALGDKINSNGWAKEDFYVDATINDQSGLGITSAKWCSTTNDTCEPDSDMVGISMTPLINVENNNNRICIEATDNNGKTSEVICSDAYKLDKTAPNVGIINLDGTLGANNWYIGDVIITATDGSDILSGHDSTNIDISSITNNTEGTTVTLTTTDLAGNVTITSEVVKVDKDAPSISPKIGTFEIVEGDSNETSTYFNSPVYSTSGGNISCTPSNTSSLSSGTQIVNCTVTGNNGLTDNASIPIDVAPLITTINYAESVRDYIVPISGVYKIEAWGAQGANSGGKGGYVSGEVNLTADSTLKINTGGTNSYNGGGSGVYKGGGATDVKLNSSALLVAAGGGGGSGGTAGGSSDGSGGTSVGSTAGTDGTNGGGGGSSADYSYSCHCSTCGGGCRSYYPTYSCNCSTCGGQCTGHSTYDCNCTTSGGQCTAWNPTYSCNCSWCGGYCSYYRWTCGYVDPAGGCHNPKQVCGHWVSAYQCNCQTCGGGCKSYAPTVTSCDTCQGACNSWAPTYDCNCSTCGGGCKSYYPTYSCNCSTCTKDGIPGNGGANVISSSLTNKINTAGVNQGNGYVKITYIGG